MRLYTASSCPTSTGQEEIKKDDRPQWLTWAVGSNEGTNVITKVVNDEKTSYS